MESNNPNILFERYWQAFQNGLKLLVCEDKNTEVNIRKILGRGVACCRENPKGGILVVGINPSYNEDLKPRPGGHEKDFSFTLKDVFKEEKPRGIWRRFKSMFDTDELRDKVAYLDLFPIRCTKQTDLQTFFKDEPKLMSAILTITQQEIERLEPKAIIIANRGSLAYWGWKKKLLWMGYYFEGFSVFNDNRIFASRIGGMRLGRIAPELYTKLTGTRVIIYGLFRGLTNKDFEKDVQIMKSLIREDRKELAIDIPVVDKFGYVYSFHLNENVEMLNYEDSNGVRYINFGQNLYSVPEDYEGELVIPDGVQYICDEVLQNCRNVTKIHFPDTITEIWRTMLSSEKIETLELPKSLKMMTSYVTEDCPRLKQIVFKTIPYISITDGPIFAGCPNLEEIIMPDGGHLRTVDGVIYSKDGVLLMCPQGKSGRIVVEEGTRFIGKCAFSGCARLTEIVLPDSLEGIYPKAFEGCTGLRRLVLSEGLKFLNGGCFVGCAERLFNRKDGCRYLPSARNDFFAWVGLDDDAVSAKVSNELEFVADFPETPLNSPFVSDKLKELVLPTGEKGEMCRKYLWEETSKRVKYDTP